MAYRPPLECRCCGTELVPADFFNRDGTIETRLTCPNVDCDCNNP